VGTTRGAERACVFDNSEHWVKCGVLAEAIPQAKRSFFLRFGLLRMRLVAPLLKTGGHSSNTAAR
jgi:hypothetical protein